MLLLLVEVKSLLDLFAQALAIRRVGVSAMLLLIHVSCSTPLSIRQPCILREAMEWLTPVWNSSCASRWLISGTISTERRLPSV
jgi:hypothetical protein